MLHGRCHTILELNGLCLLVQLLRVECTVDEKYYDCRVQEVNIEISRQIVMRCLSGHRHQVSPTVLTQMDVDLWEFWKHNTLNRVPCDNFSIRRVSYPDVGYDRYEIIEAIFWKHTMPVLDGTGWEKMKTVDTTYGSLYCSQVLWLKISWNSWTHLVRAEFEYKVERYDEEGGIWRMW